MYSMNDGAKVDRQGLEARRLPGRRIAVAAVVAAMSGCAQLLGADYTIVVERSDAGGIANGPIPEDRFAREYARVLCEGIVPCCDDAGFVFDVGVCKVRFTNFVESALAPPHGTSDVYYDARAAADCVALIDGAAKSCGEPSSTLQETCASVWRGSRSMGAPCEVAAQCTHTFRAFTYCDTVAQPDGPVCRQEIRGRQGDECTQTCDQVNGNLICHTRSPTLPVEGGFVGSLATIGPTSTICITNDGVLCDDDSGHCESLPIAPVGMPCDDPNVRCELDASCAWREGDGGIGNCNRFAGSRQLCGDLICTALVGLGESCDPIGASPIQGPQCNGSAYCNDSRVCVEKLANGSFCTRNHECRGACGGRCASSSFVVEVCTGSPSFSG
jgi:hypothetical protein